MKVLVVLMLSAALVGVGVWVAGMLLPATRVGIAKTTINAPSVLVLETILDVQRQPGWRSRVKSVERQSHHEWAETTTDGEQIRFQLMESDHDTLALTFKSTRGYFGRWTAQIESLPTKSTRIAVREEVTTVSPITRIVSHVLFKPDAFAEQYLRDLEGEVLRRQKNETK